MKHRYSALLLATLFTTSSFAATPGIGIHKESGDTTIYIPFQTTTNLLIEPYFNSYQDVYESSSSRGLYEQDINSQSFGIGIFKRNGKTGNSELYYGVRVGYQKHEYKDIYHSTTSSFYNRYRTTMSGIQIAPTIGVAYNFTPQISIAVEAAWEYYNLDGSYEYDEYYGRGEGDLKSRGHETKSRWVLRYQFD